MNKIGTGRIGGGSRGVPSGNQIDPNSGDGVAVARDETGDRPNALGTHVDLYLLAFSFNDAHRETGAPAQRIQTLDSE